MTPEPITPLIQSAGRPHDDRRRISHVALGTDVGGMERLLVEFARCADRERFRLSFISLQTRGRIAAELEALQCPVDSLDKRPGARPIVLAKLVRLLRHQKPDIVHTHNTAAYLYGVLAARLARVPALVHTRHGQRYAASSRQTWAFRIGSRLVDRIVCVSEDSRQLSIREGISPAKVCTIENGIDVDRFAFAGPAHGGPAVVVARLSPEKDVATLLRALRLVVYRIPDFRLQVLGDGSCRQQLEQLAAELGLEQSVCFLGERSDVPGILSRCSLFILPSLTEGISLTLLEAMACGVPVIATDVGGNCEVVADGQTGLLVPAADPVALADAICTLRGDRERAARFAIAGRQRVEEAFTVQRMVQRYEHLYMQLCNAQRPDESGAANLCRRPRVRPLAAPLPPSRQAG